MVRSHQKRSKFAKVEMHRWPSISPRAGDVVVEHLIGLILKSSKSQSSSKLFIFVSLYLPQSPHKACVIWLTCWTCMRECMMVYWLLPCMFSYGSSQRPNSIWPCQSLTRYPLKYPPIGILFGIGFFVFPFVTSASHLLNIVSSFYGSIVLCRES